MANTISKAPKKIWQCTWTKDVIMKIWHTPRHELKTDDERHALKLLLKYNGLHSSYMDVIANFNKRKDNAVKEGAHVQWDKGGKVSSKDVDFRARELLREIDRHHY
jgi:hypothetical protein